MLLRWGRRGGDIVANCYWQWKQHILALQRPPAAWIVPSGVLKPAANWMRPNQKHKQTCTSDLFMQNMLRVQTVQGCSTSSRQSVLPKYTKQTNTSLKRNLPTLHEIFTKPSLLTLKHCLRSKATKICPSEDDYMRDMMQKATNYTSYQTRHIIDKIYK